MENGSMKLLALNACAVRPNVAAVALVTAAYVTAVAMGGGASAFATESAKKVIPPATQTAKKPVAKTTASRAEIKSTATQIAAGVRAAEAALSPEELAIAQHIHVGQVACELGVTITIKADAQAPGYFDLESKKFKFRMFPVVSSTGAIRLQDARSDAVWLQLANKSMLMSQKLGSRLADVCMNPVQLVVAAEMEKNPPTSLLEPVKVSAQVVQGALTGPEKVTVPSLAIQ
jgi:hypothetical protein